MNAQRGTRRSFIAAVFASIVLLGTAQADLVINEVMYHPVSDNEDEEYIELYNTGPDPVLLTGWQLTGAIRYFFPPGQTLAPDAYLVVARSVAVFEAKYTTSTADVIGDYSGRLDNAGEEILLFDAAFQLVDAVAYDDEGHWPGAADGDADQIVPVKRTRDKVKALKKAGANFRYTEYPGVRHNSWENAYAEPELVSWLFSHSRRSR